MKDKKRKIDDLYDHSHQVREILGKAPNWVIRWGISVIFIVVVLLFACASFIRYNDVVHAQILVSSTNPPVYVKIPSSGRLTKVFVESGQHVNQGESLASFNSFSHSESNNNLIKSPISGKITVLDTWYNEQNIAGEKTVFTIVPHDLGEIVGRILLPIKDSEKVKKGQKVVIKIEKYPFEEWGGLQGSIEDISEVPNQGTESFYSLYIKVNGLTTSLDKQLDFVQEMQGQAEIVTEELSVLERMFYQLKSTIGIGRD
ncbi:MAG: HlyD family efflux transporter periplasmic adaptor subunit [Allomuricauda sp.]